MEWSDEGVIVGTRRHGETGVILEVMTQGRGRHLGLVRGGRSRRQRPVLQPGNRVGLIWRARLEDHLGNFTVEPIELRAGELLASALGLNAIQHLAALLRLLPERDPHPRLYDALLVVLDHIAEPTACGPLIVRFELELLNELGFGLDLSRCAVTGAPQDLAYVSPRSGRAVGRDAGQPYHDKLLRLPSFLVPGERQPGSAILPEEITQGFRLTGFFLNRHVWEARGLRVPEPRAGLIASLERALGGAEAPPRII